MHVCIHACMYVWENVQHAALTAWTVTSVAYVRRPNRRDVSSVVTEKCECQCWITQWRWQITSQFWSAGRKYAWSEAGHTTGKLLELLRCGLMETLEDDHAERENYSLWNWQPVKIITKCRCYALKLSLPHYKSRNRVQNWLQCLRGSGIYLIQLITAVV